jgi:Ca2+-binding RTX toxin-like protein
MVTKTGTGKNDNLKGGNADDILYGLDGNDILEGGQGDDDLLGGNGNDTFIARNDGYDAMDGGAGLDTVKYSQVNADYGVSISVTASGRGIAITADGYDVFKSIENFIGSKFDDDITVAKAKGGYVLGGAGDDQLFAAGGVIRGDAGDDVLFCDADVITTDTIWLQRGKDNDAVYNFRSDQDTIRLSSDEFDLGAMVGYKELVVQDGIAPVGAKAQLIFNTSDDFLYYDPDGTGSAGLELIAYFVAGDTPEAIDFEIV